MEYAEWFFRQSSKTIDGSEAGDHLESARRQMALLGKEVPAAVVPYFPQELDFLWEWYIDISRGLPSNGMAPPLISWDILKAWRDLVDVELEPWQAKALIGLGVLRVNVQMESK